jgi:hypothetical protein
LGTLVVAEPQSHIWASLGQYKLSSPSAMLRVIAQKSACFAVLERGVGMQNIQQERALAAEGLLEQSATVGGGQLQAADFVLTPNLQFSDNTGGIGAALGRQQGLVGPHGRTAGRTGRFGERAEVQRGRNHFAAGRCALGHSSGQSRGTGHRNGLRLGPLRLGQGGGYSKTPEGKLLAASLLDNHNRIVQQIRLKPALVQATSGSSQANTQASIRATPLAPAVAAVPMVVVQPAVALVQVSNCAPPTAAPPPVGQVSKSI